MIDGLNTMDKNRALIFIHIPKAAGTTFLQIVKRQYPIEALLYFDGEDTPRKIEQLRQLNSSERAKIHCLFGHIPYGLHSLLMYPARYITILRNPVDRIISHYYYVKRSADNYLHHQIKDERLSLEDYVSTNLASELNNGQVRLTCGMPSVDSVHGHAPVDQKAFEAAKSNLSENFLAVGLAEHFDRTLLLFSQYLKWGPIYYRNLNVTPERMTSQQLPTRTRQIIEDHNQYDMELYEHAIHLFEAQLHTVHFPASKLIRLNVINKAYQLAVAVKSRAQR